VSPRGLRGRLSYRSLRARRATLLAALLLAGCLRSVDLTGPGFQCAADAECQGYGPCTRGICGGSCVASAPVCPEGSQVCDGFDSDAGPLSIPGWTLRIDVDAGVRPVAGRVDEKACNQTASTYLALEDGRQAQLERRLDGGLKEVFVRAFLYLPSTLAPSGELDLVNVRLGSVETRFGLSGADGGLFVAIADGGAAVVGAAPRQQWFCFQGTVLEPDNDPSSGKVRVWLAGQPIATLAGHTAEADAGRAEQVVDLGLRSAVAQPSASLWLDNVGIAGSDVGCDEP
jgi:hypothetical protein